MLKKTSEVKIDTGEATKKASSTALGILCPYCKHLTSIKVEDLGNSHTCLTCNKTFIPSKVIDEK
jgi:uncharacterized CHY-type Zn-finger protein